MQSPLVGPSCGIFSHLIHHFVPRNMTLLHYQKLSLEGKKHLSLLLGLKISRLRSA